MAVQLPPIRFVFFFFSFLAALCTFFCCIILISSSTDEDVVSDLSWSHGSYEDLADIYISINNLVTTISGQDTQSIKWSSDSCSPDFCDQCFSANLATIILVALTLLATLPAIYTNFLRTTESGNSAANKQSAIVTSTASMVFGISSVIVFSAGCQLKIEDAYKGTGINWDYGPAFGLMITVIVFKFFDIVINAVMPLGADGCACFEGPADKSELEKTPTAKANTGANKVSLPGGHADHEQVSQAEPVDEAKGDNKV